MPPPRQTSLDRIADGYVRLVLAIHRHDAKYLDSYAGPPSWMREARRGRPVPLPILRDRAGALLTGTRAADPSERRDYLEHQIASALVFLGILSGDGPGWDGELRALFDVDPEPFDAERARRFTADLDASVPGRGPLASRLASLRRRLQVAPERVAAVIRPILDETRRRAASLLTLPAGERVSIRLVRGKPWGAFTWFLGRGHSRIAINLDMSVSLPGLLETVIHEGYPGHHVFNIMRERALVRDRGWREHRVSALFSPQIVLSEGVACSGHDLVLDAGESVAFLRDVLAPIAGVSRDAVGASAVIETDAYRTHQLQVGFEAARLRLRCGESRRSAVEFAVAHGLGRGPALHLIRFAETFGTYVCAYPAGKRLVQEFVGRGPDRAARFREVLKTPFTPSALARRAAANW